MTCYPVYIPTLNRYGHFRKQIQTAEWKWSKLPNGVAGGCRADVRML